MKELKFEHGPTLLRFRWMRLLTRLRYLPRVTIMCDPDEKGRLLIITYSVYYTFWMGGPRKLWAFYGIPETVRTAAGDVLVSSRCWNRTACDEVEYDLRTGEGRVKFHPSNPTY